MVPLGYRPPVDCLQHDRHLCGSLVLRRDVETLAGDVNNEFVIGGRMGRGGNATNEVVAAGNVCDFGVECYLHLCGFPGVGSRLEFQVLHLLRCFER